MSSKIHVVLLFVLVTMTACNNQEKAVNDVEAEPSKDTSGLFLSAKQVSYAGIEYGSISRQQLSSNVNARGELVLPINAIVDHVSQYPGVVKAIYVREGNEVRQGQLLAALNSPEFISAQQRYLMVKNSLVMLEQEYERQKELNKDKISSDKNFQKAKADYNVAMAELSGLGLQLSMAGVDLKYLEEGNISPEIKILSTQDGYVEDIVANPGKYVMQDERLMQVINMGHLLVELNVFEKDILKIKTGQNVSFSLSNLGNEMYQAKIISIGNVVYEGNRIVKVLAEFNNIYGRMLPGMFVASKIHTGEAEVEALPEEALVRIGSEGWIIYYTTAKEQDTTGTVFHSARIEKGFSQNGFTEIILKKNIPSDAMIVISGAYFLKTEQAKQAE